MYYEFTTVTIADELAELHIVAQDSDVPAQHVRVALSQKLAKRLGLNYDSLLRLTDEDDRTYYAVTTGDDQVLIRNAVDHDPETLVVGDWETYLDGSQGEFGPFVFALVDEWRNATEIRDRYLVEQASFEMQSEWPWMFYQAPREMTKRMVLDHRDFHSETIAKVQRTVARDLHYGK
ncbi:hypothetical protein [Weissella cibaria]|uniref:hypothetical protein n=1 Tax=Weissella cibaria TaxID=137591 RepID=UPI0007A63BE0|nr:hypothetical protein [Weissella cibaria]